MLVLFWKGVWRYLICVELTTRVLCFLCIDISTTENSGEQKQKKEYDAKQNTICMYSDSSVPFEQYRN